MPVQQVVRRLVDDLRPYLEEIGDWELVRHLIDEALRAGSSASRQRTAFRVREELSDVVDLLLLETPIRSRRICRSFAGRRWCCRATATR